jgi:hypothetical protein
MPEKSRAHSRKPKDVGYCLHEKEERRIVHGHIESKHGHRFLVGKCEHCGYGISRSLPSK